MIASQIKFERIPVKPEVMALDSARTSDDDKIVRARLRDVFDIIDFRHCDGLEGNRLSEQLLRLWGIDLAYKLIDSC